MFYSMGFGRAFGAAENTFSYTPFVVPADVNIFVGGNYVNGAWSRPVPDSKAQRDWEQNQTQLINSMIGLREAFRPGDATLKIANSLSQDLSFFKTYMTLKFQVMNNWTTPTATNEFYNRYFGSYQNYASLTSWLGEQSSKATEELLAEGSLAVAQVYSQMSDAKANFYVDKIVPLSKNFSKDDQSFVKDIFVYKMDGEVSMQEIVRLIAMLKPYLTATELAPILQFAPQMVLGNDYASNTLNSDLADKPYGSRNVNAEIADITGKYNSLVSRLTPYLKPEAGELFKQHIDGWRNGYYDPNNPKYSVSPTGSTLLTFFLEAVSDGLAESMTGAKVTANGSFTSASGRDAAMKAAIDSINSSNLSEEDKAKAIEMAANQIDSAINNSAQSQGKGGLLLLLAIGALALLFKKGK